ncbi:DUF4382 domain-containing protein [Piscinibacter terrae]|uniref:DUF4382 domain-containing protein n=1 Tax=Piscinibacter terrae TaxID=2496871 RepID=A0A3N7HJL0_9BURK|nr:DUF4382 domain-containing protein [Albitalea terrae]RQP22244.1 DUF4382 domain-containing protein [Albitalea terrae]
MKYGFASAAAALAASLAMLGCGGGGGGIGGTGRMGTMRVSLTDAPACGYDQVNITVDRVRVNQSSTAADGDGGWQEIVVSPARRINLLDLTNGVLDELGQTSLPAGKYTQLRLVLVDNDSTHPLANSVIPTGGSETALDTPSAQQSGLKINVDIDVAEGKEADIAIDFDACKSVVKRGNSGKYNLKPVLTAIPVISDAGLRVTGYVSPTVALPTTQVSVQFNGVPVKATVPDATTGKFTLMPLPAGTYDLVVTSSGRVTAVMTGVPVVSGTPTAVNTAGIPILPPTATMRSVSGNVLPATATVRALQSLTGGPTVEVGWAAVDAASGDFGFSLPIEAPVKAAYVANATSLTFTADAAAAGKYTIAAASAGVTKTQAIDASVAVPAVNFTFP